MKRILVMFALIAACLGATGVMAGTASAVVLPAKCTFFESPIYFDGNNTLYFGAQFNSCQRVDGVQMHRYFNLNDSGYTGIRENAPGGSNFYPHVAPYPLNGNDVEWICSPNCTSGGWTWYVPRWAGGGVCYGQSHYLYRIHNMNTGSWGSWYSHSGSTQYYSC